jgi:hypothetical protein
MPIVSGENGSLPAYFLGIEGINPLTSNQLGRGKWSTEMQSF